MTTGTTNLVAPTFRLNDRVVTPNGEVGTVVGLYNTVEGPTVGVEVKSRGSWSPEKLEHADPRAIEAANSLAVDLAKTEESLKAAHAAAAEARKAAVAAAKPVAKKRR